jgi:hypothetical protein
MRTAQVWRVPVSSAGAAAHDRGMDDAQILFLPSAERLASTNAWAFLHWLRATRGIDLAGWAGLLEWAAEAPVAARAAVRDFARQPDVAEVLIPQLAETLLFLDLRPDDVLLLADAQPNPWQTVALTGARLVRYAGPAADWLETAAREGASVVAVPAAWLDTGSFQRRQRLDVRALRLILALGGQLSAEAAGRIYAWVKPDVMLLARAGERVWGDPLSPVRARVAYAPSLGSLLRRSGRFSS